MATEPEIIAGIDLGTTYSCIAVVNEHGIPVVLKNREGKPTTASVVLFESPENIIVGDDAKNAQKNSPEKIVAFAKRKMGQSDFPPWEMDGVEYRPENVSALILKKVIQDAEEALGRPIKKAVITVPAYFGAAERTATENAGVLAGIEVAAILDEPSAAAFSYGVDKQGDQTLLVYDLGGGTFDITLVSVNGRKVTVLAKQGLRELGGKDWDEKIMGYCIGQCADQLGRPVAEVEGGLDEIAKSELRAFAEEAKRSLSTRTSVPINWTFDGQRVKVELTRDQFNSITSDLLQQASDLVEKLLGEAKAMGAPDFDKILLVGGSSRMPQVVESLKKYGKEPQLFEPDEAVAKGAAIYAMSEQLKADYQDLLSKGRTKEQATKELATAKLLPGKTVTEMLEKESISVTSRCYGVVVDENDVDKVDFLIKRNTPVPAEGSATYGTKKAGQTGVMIQVMEGTDESNRDPTLNKEVGTAQLTDLPSLPAGSPIEVTFIVGRDGMLTAVGKDLTSGKSIRGEFRPEGALTKQQIEEMSKALAKLVVS